MCNFIIQRREIIKWFYNHLFLSKRTFAKRKLKKEANVRVQEQISEILVPIKKMKYLCVGFELVKHVGDAIHGVREAPQP